MTNHLFGFFFKIYFNDEFHCRRRFIWYLDYSSTRSSFCVATSLVRPTCVIIMVD